MSTPSANSDHSSKAAQNHMEFQVNSEFDGKRLDIFLAHELTDQGISRQKIKLLIAGGNTSIDGVASTLPKQKIFSGQIIRLTLPVAEGDSPEAQVGNLSIIYQDKNFLVLNKPPHLTVHPCPSCPNGTLVNILLHHFPELGNAPGLRPGIVHRLDKDTSGLLVIALSESARLKLAEAFAARAVEKEYLALVMGIPDSNSGIINQPVGRHPTLKTRMAIVPHGKDAISEYRVLFSAKGNYTSNGNGEAVRKANSTNDFSLLAVKIHTGRTHQIRVHLAHIGHPIWGDSLYGGSKFLVLPSGRLKAKPETRFKVAYRQMLHAWRLQFKHPETREHLCFHSNPPPDFLNTIKNLLTSPLKVVVTGLPGCGKSSLLKELSQLGLPVWSADAEVHNLYSPGEDGWLMLKNRFGGRFIEENGELNKQALFTSMQIEPGLRREVEELIHPLVSHRLSEFWTNPVCGGSSAEKRPFLTAEVPLFLEAGWERGKFNWEGAWGKICKRTNFTTLKFNPHSNPGDIILIYTDAPASLRYERLIKKGISAEQAATLDSWQWPETAKQKACDIIVDNSGNPTQLKTSAAELLRILFELSSIRDELILRSVPFQD